MGRGPGPPSVIGLQITAVDDRDGGQLPSTIITNETNVSHPGGQGSVGPVVPVPTPLGAFNKLPNLPPQVSLDGNIITDIGTNIQNPLIGAANPATGTSRRFKMTAVGSAASALTPGRLPGPWPGGSGGFNQDVSSGYVETYEFNTAVSISEYDEGDAKYMGWEFLFPVEPKLTDATYDRPQLTTNGTTRRADVHAPSEQIQVPQAGDYDRLYLGYFGNAGEANYAVNWYLDTFRAGKSKTYKMCDGTFVSPEDRPTVMQRAEIIWGVTQDYGLDATYATADRTPSSGTHQNAGYHTFTDATAATMYEFSEPSAFAAQISFAEQDGSETGARSGMLLRASYEDVFNRLDTSYTFTNPGFSYASTTEPVNSGYIGYSDTNLLNGLTLSAEYGTALKEENNYAVNNTFDGFALQAFYNVNPNPKIEYGSFYIATHGSMQAVTAPVDGGGDPEPGFMSVQWGFNYTMGTIVLSSTDVTGPRLFSSNFDVPVGTGTTDGLATATVSSGRTDLGTSIRTTFKY